MMAASTCISRSCVDARVPVRASYMNMYKWPESDFEFVRSINISKPGEKPANIYSTYGHPRVVDSISCRQLYLRSYTFSREEDYKEDDSSTLKCLGGGRSRQRKYSGRADCSKKAKVSSCSAALASIFRGLLSCTTKVDVAN